MTPCDAAALRPMIIRTSSVTGPAGAGPAAMARGGILAIPRFPSSLKIKACIILPHERRSYHMSTQRTLAQAIEAGTYVLPRQTWGAVDPRPRIVVAKKGKGSYQRRAKHPAHEDHAFAS